MDQRTRVERLKEEGQRLAGGQAARTDSTSWTRPFFRVQIIGPRSGGYVEFQLDGKRSRVVRW